MVWSGLFQRSMREEKIRVEACRSFGGRFHECLPNELSLERCDTSECGYIREIPKFFCEVNRSIDSQLFHHICL